MSDYFDVVARALTHSWNLPPSTQHSSPSGSVGVVIVLRFAPIGILPDVRHHASRMTCDHGFAYG